MKNTKGILVQNFTEDKVRRLIQQDDNLKDCRSGSNWVQGETKKGHSFLEITLQSKDKLRVYDKGFNKEHKIQFLNGNNWSVKVKASGNLEKSKEKVFDWYNKAM